MKPCQLQRSKEFLEKLIDFQLFNKLLTPHEVRLFTNFQQDRTLGSAAAFLRTTFLTCDKDTQVHIHLPLLYQNFFFMNFWSIPCMLHAFAIFYSIILSS